MGSQNFKERVKQVYNVEDCTHLKPIILSYTLVLNTYLKTVTHWLNPNTSVVVFISTDNNSASFASLAIYFWINNFMILIILLTIILLINYLTTPSSPPFLELVFEVFSTDLFILIPFLHGF